MADFFSGSEPDFINKKVMVKYQNILKDGATTTTITPGWSDYLANFYEEYISPNLIFIILFVVLVLFLMYRYKYKDLDKPEETFKPTFNPYYPLSD